MMRELDADMRSMLRDADEHAKRGDGDAAADGYERASDRFSAAGQDLKAVAVLQTALVCRPDRVDLRLKLGEGLARLGLVGDARQALRLAADEADRIDDAALRDRAARALAELPG